MQLEDYFNFLGVNDIRLKGTRVGIETVLYEYIYHRQSPEEIAHLYPHLSLEQIYATILYFLHDQERMTQYMADWLKYCHKSEQQQDENPPPYVLRLRQLKVERGISTYAKLFTLSFCSCRDSEMER